jgi:prophage regulatory protein
MNGSQMSKPPKLLSRNDLKNLGIDYCNVHLLRLEAEGKFPKRLYLSPARVAWVESEILEYLTRCIAARG